MKYLLFAFSRFLTKKLINLTVCSIQFNLNKKYKCFNQTFVRSFDSNYFRSYIKLLKLKEFKLIGCLET